MLKLTQKLPGKRAFITGAASGLGRAFALTLAADGWTLGISDINEAGLSTTAHEITQAGGNPLVFLLDVSDKIQYESVARSFVDQVHGIDLLINNAGVGDGSLFEQYSLENYEWMVAVNQMSVVYGCYFFLPHFKKQRSGHIITIASLAAISCAPTMGAYNMTKAAVVAISETIYCELLEFNVGVSCVKPSYFKTNINQFARGGDSIKRATQKMMELSGLQPAEVAHEILTRAGNGELYIVLPKAARKLWRLKRLAPTWFRKKVNESFMRALKRLQNG
jgi:short-subunit dehydrogenase